MVQAYLSGTQGNETLTFTIWDNEEKITEAQADAANPNASMTIVNVHLWNGRKDPHLYTLKAV
ncbi:hypothetical protein, partial [Salmonella enterica]|uniref:hypothetical protein n=1 Tax=Salmonella enterica TaxID=28901 RepID=UPI0020C4490C